MTRVSDSLFKE